MRCGRQLRARKPGRDRARPRRPRTGAGAAGGERPPASRRHGDDAGLATVLVRRGVHLAERGRLGQRASQLERALELRPAERPPRARARPRRSRAGRDVLRAITPAPIGTSPRRATSFGVRATAGASRARSGGPPTWPSRADAWMRRKPLCRRRTRCSTDAARALDREHARGAGRGRHPPRRSPQAAALLAEARRRYAAGDDAVGLGNIDERLDRLAKEALRSSN